MGERKLIEEILKKKEHIRCRYFDLAFERLLYDLRFLRSPRHKNDAYVEKERKKELDGSRAELETETRCEALDFEQENLGVL